MLGSFTTGPGTKSGSGKNENILRFGFLSIFTLEDEEEHPRLFYFKPGSPRSHRRQDEQRRRGIFNHPGERKRGRYDFRGCPVQIQIHPYDQAP